MASAPWHALAEVRALAAAGAVDFGKTSALDRLIPHLGDGARAEAFGRAVLGQLQAGDFIRQVALDSRATTGPRKVVFDEYATRLAAAVLEAHGLGHKSTWYVKLRIYSPTARRKVLALSMHCLMDPARRANGTTLSPTWKESE
jgi:hypothetical protein